MMFSAAEIYSGARGVADDSAVFTRVRAAACLISQRATKTKQFPPSSTLDRFFESSSTFQLRRCTLQSYLLVNTL